MVMYDNNMIMSLKQKKRKFEPRIKLNHNIQCTHVYQRVLVPARKLGSWGICLQMRVVITYTEQFLSKREATTLKVDSSCRIGFCATVSKQCAGQVHI